MVSVRYRRPPGGPGVVKASFSNSQHLAQRMPAGAPVPVGMLAVMKARRYRIEDHLRQEAPAHAAAHAAAHGPGDAAGPSGAPDPRIGQILSTVLELKRAVQPEKLVGDAIEACRRDIGEVYALRAEIDLMKEAITHTKLEIATIQRSETEGKGMRRVAGELDAVVDSTERATTTILSAVEEIETHAGLLRAVKASASGAEAILDRVVVLYEACNFQDLTGQRIGKIVSVLKFVEERLDRMIDVWGGLEAFKDIPAAGHDAPVDPDRSLLNGPKLEEDPGHVDQSDIDALFG